MQNMNSDFSIDDLVLCRSLNDYVKIKGYDEDTKLYKIEMIDKKDTPNDPAEGFKFTAIEEMIVSIKEKILKESKDLEFDDSYSEERFYDHEKTWEF